MTAGAVCYPMKPLPAAKSRNLANLLLQNRGNMGWAGHLCNEDYAPAIKLLPKRFGARFYAFRALFLFSGKISCKLIIGRYHCIAVPFMTS